MTPSGTAKASQHREHFQISASWIPPWLSSAIRSCYQVLVSTQEKAIACIIWFGVSLGPHKPTSQRLVTQT